MKSEDEGDGGVQKYTTKGDVIYEQPCQVL